MNNKDHENPEFPNRLTTKMLNKPKHSNEAENQNPVIVKILLVNSILVFILTDSYKTKD